ncbi:ATP-dependent protease ATPase subunit HslU [Sporosalibacterium faouarense]|uniref:ATP-dependent protease ATPase subunit HslU n=1 Tax=Sporosalibacterium faouarense TaxID=516123 RepID=UPI00141D2B35|nr:ATP-dependent protease ATPase subunit HslU [Sporosalibacterium faouarense]MTI47981.1 ATP-dependent protease ATPase subunit HslU [Bacillota bacterium]
MKELTPKQIVKELDRYIIGQDKAKKSVAIALRNRYRRSLLNEEFQEEIKPKNILMIGPTGVGKTEIARRLAKLAHAPFIKIEATKFTEVGYVGRDVESMIRDLVETSIRMIKSKRVEEVYDKGKKVALDRIVDIMIPMPGDKKSFSNPLEAILGVNYSKDEENTENSNDEEDLEYKREELKEKLKKSELDDEIIEIEVEENKNSSVGMLGLGMDELNINLNDMFGGLVPKSTKKRKVTIKEAKKILASEEAQKLIDMDEVVSEGISRAEDHGIIFIDEIDKIAGRGYGSGPDVSREGVQRDILPIIEGSTVMTKHGPVKTDHILFIAAGAFHVAKVTDLIPEIQGRFPIRVELEKLTEENFKEILIKPKNALTKQYQLLLETEGVEVIFNDEGIRELAKYAFLINEETENIGARRLHTILEELLEDLSFEAPEVGNKKIVIDNNYVKEKLSSKIKEMNMEKYIL